MVQVLVDGFPAFGTPQPARWTQPTFRWESLFPSFVGAALFSPGDAFPLALLNDGAFNVAKVPRSPALAPTFGLRVACPRQRRESENFPDYWPSGTDRIDECLVSVDVME